MGYIDNAAFRKNLFFSFMVCNFLIQFFIPNMLAIFVRLPNRSRPEPMMAQHWLIVLSDGCSKFIMGIWNPIFLFLAYKIARSWVFCSMQGICHFFHCAIFLYKSPCIIENCNNSGEFCMTYEYNMQCYSGSNQNKYKIISLFSSGLFHFLNIIGKQ